MKLASWECVQGNAALTVAPVMKQVAGSRSGLLERAPKEVHALYVEKKRRRNACQHRRDVGGLKRAKEGRMQRSGENWQAGSAFDRKHQGWAAVEAPPRDL